MNRHKISVSRFLFEEFFLEKLILRTVRFVVVVVNTFSCFKLYCDPMFSLVKNSILRIDRLLRSQSGDDWVLLATWRCAFLLAIFAGLVTTAVLVLPVISHLVNLLVSILIHPAMIGVYLLVVTAFGAVWYWRWMPAIEADDDGDFNGDRENDSL